MDDEDDFNWSDYFRSQFAEVVSADAIERFKSEYQGSEEEKLDVIGSYVNNEGDMNALFEEVMLSNPIHDEDRFRKIIDDEIAAKRVEAYSAYVKESKAKRKKRVTEAKKEAEEAMEMAEELGVKEKLFGTDGTNGHAGAAKKGKKSEPDISGLSAIIQQRQKSRADNFLADLEAKYAPKTKNGAAKGQSKRNSKVLEEPPEEAFQKNRRKGKSSEAPADEAEEDVPRRTKRARRA